MKSVGVLVSSPREAKAFVPALNHLTPVKTASNLWIISTGSGAENIQKATAKLILKGVEGLISFGFAGGIDPHLPCGTLLMPHKLIHPTGEILQTDKAWLQSIQKQIPKKFEVSDKPLIHAPHLIHTLSEKQFLYERTHGAGIDQESYIMAQMAHDSKIPFIALRVILDDAHTRLPEAVARIQNELGHISYQALFKALCNPVHWHDIYRLSQHVNSSHAALKALSACKLRGGHFI